MGQRCHHRRTHCLLCTWSEKLLVQSRYRGCSLGLCTGLRHCCSHSYVGFLLIFHSGIPICPSPPPSDALFSKELIQSFLITLSPLHPPFTVPLITQIRTQVGFFIRVETPVSLFTAAGDRCMPVRSTA